MKNFKQLRERDEVWDRPNPKAERGDSKKLSPAQKARARARARPVAVAVGLGLLGACGERTVQHRTQQTARSSFFPSHPP